MENVNNYVISECKGNGPHGGTVRLLDGRPIGKGVGVRLPSGMTHWFDDMHDAISSDYWPVSAEPKYKITGVEVSGKRFRIFTHNRNHALCINLWRGSVWEHDGSKYRRIKYVWN